MAKSNNPDENSKEVLDAKVAAWGAEALHDEEHVAITARCIIGMLSEPDSQLLRDIREGMITLEAAASFVSLLVSIDTTDRNFGGSPAVASVVVKLIPPDLLL